MTSTPRQLLEALGVPLPTSKSADSRFSVRTKLHGAFLARSPAMRGCLLIPVKPMPLSAMGRVCGGVSLTFERDVLFDVEGTRWNGATAVLECLDETFLPAFCVLVADLASRLTADVETLSCIAVVAALADWERLFRARRRLSDAQELGLWAELLLTSLFPDVDAAIRAWRGPFGNATDFFGNGVGIECKASRRRLQHHISVGQVGKARGKFPVYLASLWVDLDPHAGTTLNEVIANLERVTTETILLEKALLASGYSRMDAALYRTRYRSLENPSWFAQESVPQIRSMDAGISEVRYVAELDETKALDESAIRSLMNQFVGALK